MRRFELVDGKSSKSALGLVGNDETAGKLTPMIRAWPGQGQHSRAVTGLDILLAIGSDVALMHLNVRHEAQEEPMT